MIQITIITLICCLLFGVPIAFAIGIAGTAGLYFGSTAPMFMVVKQFFEGINSFSYMAIPLFILAGAIMGKGGISKRIVNFASAILSWLRGGTAITTVGASMIFAAVSGSGAATIVLIYLVIDGLKNKYKYYSKKWGMGPYAEVENEK